MEVVRKSEIPLFRDFKVAQLCRLTSYSKAYLEDIERGHQPCRPLFRSSISRQLGIPEKELFGEAA